MTPAPRPATVPRVSVTDLFHAALADISVRLPVFSHVDPRRLLVSLASSQRTPGGAYARIAALRFPDGSSTSVSRGELLAMPQIPTPWGDILYIVYIHFDRYYTLDFTARLQTLIHELYHIAPAFDGTHRRIGRRFHGHSRAEYHDSLAPLVDAYLAAPPDPAALAFLRADLPVLRKRGKLVGASIPLPRPIRIAPATSPALDGQTAQASLPLPLYACPLEDITPC